MKRFPRALLAGLLILSFLSSTSCSEPASDTAQNDISQGDVGTQDRDGGELENDARESDVEVDVRDAEVVSDADTDIEPTESPAASCDAPIDAIDTSDPDHIIGEGTPESCTEDALRAATDEGGIIVFDCGPDPTTIDITAALQLRTDTDTTIDGAGLITLDGGRTQGRTTRVFDYHSPDYRVTETLVTLQGLTIQNAEAPAEDYTAPDPDNEQCAWGYKDGAGGALKMRDGRLHVIDSVFRGNRAAPTGPDTGGGALYVLGAIEVIVVGSVFTDNQGSNGGAIGLLQTDAIVVNTELRENHATGEGLNFGGATGCPDFNHGEQGGAGGNGGAIAIDGSSVDRVEFCGVSFIDNEAGGLGTVFRTPNTQRGTSSFHRAHFEGNFTEAGGGAIYMQDMEFSLTESAITNNSSNGLGGGVRVVSGAHGSTLLIENTTIARNIAYDGLGGGLVFSGEGLLRNVTFAENEAAGGEGFFGAAIVAHGDESSGLNVHNTVFWNNTDDHQWTPMTCSIGNPGTPTELPGTHNFQWPVERNGDNAPDDNPCTTDIQFADAELGALQDNGGPTPTMMPAEASVVVGAGADCPATDQRGESRPEDGCTAGAVEWQN